MNDIPKGISTEAKAPTPNVMIGLNTSDLPTKPFKPNMPTNQSSAARYAKNAALPTGQHMLWEAKRCGAFVIAVL